MTKHLLKTLPIILLVCSAFMARAQNGYNYAQYDIGTAVGFDKVYGDAETVTTTQSIHFNFTYNATPFVNFVFETQLGKLRGGDSVLTKSGRYFNNDFAAFIFRGQLQLGEIMDYSRSPLQNALKNLYVSAGLGFVRNHITQVSRNSQQIADFYTGGDDKSKEPFIPLRIGYEIKLFNRYSQPSAKIDLGYGYNYILGDDLDGFVAGGKKDVYTQFTLGVKFAIGSALTSYRKQITY
ncbi:MAG: hypothetical protein ACTHMI_08180 [Mucilaginibacter sp.]|uniref:hypothetical protein n=1 Tax=Mucilaginibacter sp. L3T2-6 TaxID=3062491 RepID=UPI00267726A0|nr:hypothetical protein [Mucilaginibacter sp. L3T2-6]MDO3644285.1 hypothetical protein [Mucilaginibacter sp. L3T2-6]MDV6216736.1 hypothetical protein [Mucilaginibacter sp. L3T2-6]